MKGCDIMIKKYVIYIHKNKINGKVYIGQTSQNPIKRWDNGKGYITSPKFYSAILKYGWNNFEHIILYTDLTQEQANQIEQELIQQYNSQNDQYGYNITSGGCNFSHSVETKQKIGKANSIALKGNNHSKEQNELMSQKFKGENNPFYGKHHTEETKQKISNARKGKFTGSNHPFYGKHHTEESLQKMGQNRQGKGGKKVICEQTGEIFECMMDAARWCGLTTACSIGQCCMGKVKTAGKHPITKEKLTWRYLDG